jgi:hypothetical protein
MKCAGESLVFAGPRRDDCKAAHAVQVVAARPLRIRLNEYATAPTPRRPRLRFWLPSAASSVTGSSARRFTRLSCSWELW